MQPWGFYGRQRELADLRTILERGRWFFVQVSGRRRIGKTSLIQQALNQAGRQKPMAYDTSMAAMAIMARVESSNRPGPPNR